MCLNSASNEERKPIMVSLKGKKRMKFFCILFWHPKKTSAITAHFPVLFVNQSEYSLFSSMVFKKIFLRCLIILDYFTTNDNIVI